VREVSSPAEAAHALAQGHLAILPTETVYGLGADADNPEAVGRIFTTKNRPANHPVIVHIAQQEHIYMWATDIPEYAVDLGTAFWPGPVTLVLKRLPRSGDYLTGGQETIALRVSSHPVFQEVLAKLAHNKNDPAVGIAAPSANRFGSVSPTTLAHTIEELGEYLTDEDVALDGGSSHVGVESTIIDATGSEPIILRHGGITVEDIESVIKLSQSESDVRAPGTLASHYAPNKQLRLVTPSELLKKTPGALIALRDVETPIGFNRIASPENVNEYAQMLYAAIRDADKSSEAVIYAVPPTGGGIAAAIRDRLNRAATKE
jgi:L-threonylcarbamoyladenylate synthase